MGTKEKPMAEKNQPKETRKEWKRLLSHKWMVKNVPFFLFLAALAVVYIYNGHYADKTIRDVNRIQSEIKEMQFEYKSLQSEIMFRSKESELARGVAIFGLKEPMAPPVVLTDTLYTGNNRKEKLNN